VKNMFAETVESIETWFNGLFDFLPSLDEVKNTLISFLPDWMKPEAVEEQRSRLEAELQNKQNLLQNKDSMRPETVQNYELDVQRIKAKLAELPEARRGGIVDMPKTGGLANLHGREAIIPLDKEGISEVQRVIGTNIIERKTNAVVAGTERGYTQPALMIKGGSSVYNDNRKVVNSSTKNISTATEKVLKPHLPA